MLKISENVAINKRKQKAFKSSVENYKQLLKKGKIEIAEHIKPTKKSAAKSERGVVFLSNIPHGFYEEQMKQYFHQFGRVTRLRLARSKKTGKSKGYAFIEFQLPEVAEIVAETMDKYLMCKRLLKAKYIAPEEQQQKFFTGRNFTKTFYPKLMNRKKEILKNNYTKITDVDEISKNKKMLNSVEKVKKKLKDLGIDYNFQPVDVPNALKNSKEESEIDDSDAPVLEIDESDDDIVFQTPPGVKRIVKPKSSESIISLKSNFVKLDKPKNTKNKQVKQKTSKQDGTKKLTGISKKPKVIKVSNEQESKKLKLIQKNISDSDQVNLKNFKEIKNKKLNQSKDQPKNFVSLKSPKTKKAMNKK